jgi:cytochrome c biogenesis protein CcdA
VIAISLFAGVINIKDFFYYGKGITLGIPKKTKKYLMGLINRASVPASFILGVSVAILEAPCSVPIYLAVIEILKAEGSTLAAVFPYVLIYNLMFILPLVVLSLAVYFGYKAEYFEKASLKNKRYMKLIIGIILIILAIVLLLGWL